MDCKIHCPHAQEGGGGYLFRSLSVLHRYGKIYISSQLKELGIGNCQPPYLMAIFVHPGMSQEQLSNFLKIDKGAVAKTVSQMIEEGYIYKKQNEEDKRCYNLFLTEKGKGIIPQMRNLEISFEKMLTKGIDPEGKKLLQKLLHKLTANLLTERGISINETLT